MLKNEKLVTAFAALIDQAWLSLLNFAVSLAFIRAAPKEEYGLYILLLTPVFLIQGVQNALFLSPQATILPASALEKKTTVRATSSALQAGFGLISGVLGVVVLLIYQYVTLQMFDLMLALAFGFGTVGALAREGIRASQYVEGMATRALFGDLIYGFLLMACIALFMAGDEVTARNVLAAMGLAGVLPLARMALVKTGLKIDRGVWKEFWACGRWALPAVLVTWLNFNSYSYVVAAVLGAALVADISAARLFLMPVGLTITAWSNLARPKISAMHARRDFSAIRRLSLNSITVGITALAGYMLIIMLAYPWLESLLGKNYSGLLPLTLAWAVFFFMNLPRCVLMATLMTTPSGYRELHHFSWLALMLLIPGLTIFSPHGATWVIGVLCAVELLQALLIGRSALAKWPRGLK